MSSYYMVRGWIECVYEDVELVKSVACASWSRFNEFCVDEELASSYWGGWFFPSGPINWVSYVFYGATVNSVAYHFIRYVFDEIAASNPELSGVFYLDDEDGDKSTVLLMDGGKISEKIR